MREVDSNLIIKLETLADCSSDICFWEEFYEFIVLNYEMPSEKRFGISDLFFELKRLNIPKTGEMVKIYAHSMYVLAKYNHQKIYGDNFNV